MKYISIKFKDEKIQPVELEFINRRLFKKTLKDMLGIDEDEYRRDFVYLAIDVESNLIDCPETKVGDSISDFGFEIKVIKIT